MKEDGNQTFTDFDEIIQSGKKYNIIYADPPWSYMLTGANGAVKEYDVMPLEDIKKIPVSEIAAKDSVLCMWITFPLLNKIDEIINAWGFKYSTVLFVWIKKNKNKNGVFYGCGYYTRSNAEIVILAKRGKGCKIRKKNIHQVHMSNLREHSRKPDGIRNKIIELFGDDVSRIELFARTKIDGWDVFGNDKKLTNNTQMEQFGNEQ